MANPPSRGRGVRRTTPASPAVETPQRVDEGHVPDAAALARFLRRHGPFDIVVGINAKNVETTIIHVLNVVCSGLQSQFGTFRNLVVVVDGHSTDATADLARYYPSPQGVAKLVLQQRHGPGKGNGVRTLLEVARDAGAQVAVCVDGDLVSIQPVWLEGLVRPVLYGLADLVAPYYLRDKWDSVITNHLCYPFTAALYGSSPRQPIGGEFSFSREMARRLLEDHMPPHFGIDIFVTTTALASGLRIQEAPLGIKVHASTTGYVDPDAALTRMYMEVVGTMMDLAVLYEDRWARPLGPGPVLLSERAIPYYGRVPPATRIHAPRLRQVFNRGLAKRRRALRRVLPPDLLAEIERHRRSGLTADLWARTVWSIAAWFVGAPRRDVQRQRAQVLNALGALGMGRFLRFVAETRRKDLTQASELIRKQAHVFARTRPEFLRRMRQLRAARVQEAPRRGPRRKRGGRARRSRRAQAQPYKRRAGGKSVGAPSSGG